MLPPELTSQLPHDFSLAIRTTVQNHAKAYKILDIARYPSVCLTLHKTAYNWRSHLQNAGIDTSKVHVIDPLSSVIGSKLKSHQTTHVPYNLHQMMEAAEHAIQQTPPKQRVMIVDAFHALPLIYTDETVIAFLKAFSNNMRILHAHTIYLYDKDKLHPPVSTTLQKVVDKVIEMN